MQSGISASTDLHAAFSSFLSTPSAFALLVTITGESLTPLETISSSNSSFHSSLPLLTPYLQPTRPLYLLLRRHTSDASLICVTYVPDAAPVRQKMLFASTRLTLTRELGPEKFRNSMFVTDPTELEPESFERWERSEEGAEGEQPLTREEEAEKRIKAGEEEVRQGAGTGERRLIGGGGMKMAVGAGVMEKLEALSRGGENLVMLRIDVTAESIELAGTATTNPASLASSITDDEPRYSFFRYSESSDAPEGPPIIFVYTCPSGSKIKERMLYASSKLTFVNAVKDEAKLNVVKRLEASSPSEITADAIEEEFTPKQEQKQGFSRPKRPGKR
ncbi:MAG: hypothetical protein Q9191_001698 [Dirinaria sp. TL-2023a]